MGYLHDMIDRRRASVKAYVGGFSGDKLKSRLEKTRDARNVIQLLLESPNVAVIAEVRKASAASGDIALFANTSQLAGAFEEGGAAFVAICTEPDDGRGDFGDIDEAAGSVDLPVIARDYTVTTEQMALFRAFGADAFTVHAGQVGDKLPSFIKLGIHIGLVPIVEVNRAEELDLALSCGAPLVLIDPVDPDTHQRDESALSDLIAAAKAGDALVAVALESADRAAVKRIAKAGADAVWVAEAATASTDPRGLIEQLAGVRRRREPHHTSLMARGVATPDQGVAVAAAGASAVAVEIDAGDGRDGALSAEKAADIFNKLPSSVRCVGVFRDAPVDKVCEAVSVAGVDSVEWHGAGRPVEIAQVGRPVIKAVDPGPRGRLSAAELSLYGEPVVSFLVELSDAEQVKTLAPLPAVAPCIIAGFAPHETQAVVVGLEPAAVVADVTGLAPDASANIVAEMLAGARSGDEALNTQD